MSSENRSISPYTFESEVPALEDEVGRGGPSSKMCFRVQQTQKSFSMTPGVMFPHWAAASVKRSLRSFGGPSRDVIHDE